MTYKIKLTEYKETIVTVEADSRSKAFADAIVVYSTEKGCLEKVVHELRPELVEYED